MLSGGDRSWDRGGDIKFRGGGGGDIKVSDGDIKVKW